MNRTERLFQIVEILRSRRTTTAQYLADRLGLSVRTIYRHINDLTLSGIPVISETGVGYWLDQSFDMPPLMFNEEELLALSFGAKLVQQTADDYLADAAASLLQKIQHSLPQQKQPLLDQMVLHAPSGLVDKKYKKKMALCRAAIDKQQVLSLQYSDANGDYSERLIRPLALAFWGKVWTLAAWCEKRRDFRAFRLDRMHSLMLTAVFFSSSEEISLKAFIHSQEQAALLPAADSGKAL
ncbi:helix-turn-helix transcriptional regulator [Psychromonas ossibalaenae]|uniref:helix-turn-helix transcriptional regulator n=1 Tax=Psychromonas ossibalaenae TaxID=444922 RepID=UPI00036BAD5F|nr:YafY family protein [Psychromonas ossibalaenae]